MVFSVTVLPSYSPRCLSGPPLPAGEETGRLVVYLSSPVTQLLRASAASVSTPQLSALLPSRPNCFGVSRNTIAASYASYLSWCLFPRDLSSVIQPSCHLPFKPLWIHLLSPPSVLHGLPPSFTRTLILFFSLFLCSFTSFFDFV